MSVESRPSKNSHRSRTQEPATHDSFYEAEELLKFPGGILRKAAEELGMKNETLQNILYVARLICDSTHPASIYRPLPSVAQDGHMILADTIADPQDCIAEAEREIDRNLNSKFQ